MWANILTIIKQRRNLRTAGLLALCVALITTLFFDVSSYAAPGINQTISFQGRLQYATGGAVADGFYNMQFKIYQDGTKTSGGTLEWTETYINDNNSEGVEVKNGYFSVELGSTNAFGNQVDWNQDTLWLTMNVAGSADNCTSFNSGACVADGEMNPRQRFTSTPYSLNSGALNGKTADNFVQLGQGVQEDVANNSNSIFINKTGTNGAFLQLQNAGIDVLRVDNAGDIEFGNQPTHYIGIAQADPNTTGNNISINAGNGGDGTGSTGGNLLLQGGIAGGENGDGGNVWIDGGNSSGTGEDGSIEIGSARGRHIIVGSMWGDKTQDIHIGNNQGGGTTNVTVGSSGSAAGGSTNIQSKDNTTISTDGVDRAVFDTNGNLILGNGESSATPDDFTIQGTTSTADSVTGGSLTIQGGGATTGNANGGNLTLSGGSGAGTGTNGLVVISTPTFSTTSNDANCYASGALVASTCTITAASINNTSAIIVGFSTAGQTANVPDPTNTTAGRIVYITAANGSNDFTLSLNGGGTGNLTSMRQNTSATLIWNGSDWTVAGASNSTTLQSAYNNTLQSAGGAELIVSNGSNANGLTIRDSSTDPVNGALIEVQNASASTLFSVNSNVPEYATNGGAETAGGSSSTFPSDTWVRYSSDLNSTITRYTTPGNNIASGQSSVQVATNGVHAGVSNRLSTALTPNMRYNVSFATRVASGSFTDMHVSYLLDGFTISAVCKENITVNSSNWTRVNCSFQAPSGGITSDNTIIIKQIGYATRTFYVDNLSVTIAGNQNYATDGNVNNNGSFATNWNSAGQGTVNVTRNTSDGKESSDSAEAEITTGAANAGLRNKLSIAPLPNTLYRLTVHAKLSADTFTDFKLRYSRDGGTNFADCVDYNTQTLSTTEWTEVSCYITTDGTAATNPYAYFVETSAEERTFMVDSFEMTLATNTSANVQIGGGSHGGQTTLFTLDQGASAPIADNNDALLGSMYYDTTLGKIQCYEADGWGACGSSPDNVVTISPEYTNAVMRGTGVGTMTSDFCSNTDALSINTDICGTGQTYNFYKWTSPQTNNQTYSIYVTYQLPSTFKSFASGQTSLKGRTDAGSNGGDATIKYSILRNSNGDLSTCGGPGHTVDVSSGTETQWQNGVATGTADPSTCGFEPGDSIVFKIDVIANKNAAAYVSNLGFTFSNN